MNYQITGNNNQSGFDNTLFGGVGVAGSAEGANGKGSGASSILSGNSVGDLLACKLVKGGKEPVLDLNGIQIKTKAAKELDSAKPGDTIYLKIQEAAGKKVSLKIVGTKSQEQVPVLNAATSAQVMQSTEQFSDMIKENLDGALDEKQAKENQKEILRSLSSEEIGKLRMMQIDVTNATLSDLMGMVINIRTSEHQDEVNERISDVVKETIGKLRESVMAGKDGYTQPATDMTEMASEASVTADTETSAQPEATPYPGGARLNSEGYIVSVAESRATSTSASDYMGSSSDANGVNEGVAQGVTAAKNDTIKNGDRPIITEEQMVYMVKNHMDLTIENLNIAKNSVNEGSPLQEVPIHNQVWNDIYPQVTGIIEAAGMSVTEQSLSGAKFMLSHELPITVDSLRTYMSVNYMNQRGIQVSQLKANVEEQIAMGNMPEQARVYGRTLRDKATQLVEKVQGITPRAVDKAVAQGKPLSISYLYNSSMRSADIARMRTPVNTGVEGASLSLSGVGQETVAESGIPLSTNPSAVSARRQLEEIRLSMTVEAATRLVKLDINIDAKPLSQIVDVLREQENQFYENVVSSHDLHDIPDDVDLLKESLKQTEGLKVLPEYTIGEMVKRPSITVGALYETGVRIKSSLAGVAYETMMTRPRSDMGDSITTAFQNVDDILSDMGMDRNEENQRAIRILAYNQMELNRGNVASVKSADAKVQQMFETLTPQIVLNLIREGKNPLNMTMDGLNEEIMQQRETRGITDEQRFSEFLYQMDRQNAITEEERKSFIGIYRLLDKVQKSHGKDIGAVVRNGQEVTLNNLFAADKSRKVQGMDFSVDDKFGERVSVETQGESILSQVQTAYNQTLAGSILRHIRPETLKSLEGMDYRNMSFEELNSLMKAADNGVGQSELTEQLSQDLQEALSYEDSVATMLEAHDMPHTVTNLIAAHQVMYGEDSIYGMVRKIKSNLSKESQDKITRQEASILENLESKDDVVYGLENIRSALSEAVHEKEVDGTITAMDIQALKHLNAGMPIAMRAVAEDVFRIPLVVDDEVSIMKVSILRDGRNAGEITATMDTARYGVLEAFMRVSGDQIEGYVVTEEESGQRKLEENELTLRSVFAKAGMGIKDVRLDGTKPMQYTDATNREEIATSKLYKVAKQLLTAIKLTGITADN